MEKGELTENAIALVRYFIIDLINCEQMPLFLTKPKKHVEPAKTAVKMPLILAKVNEHKTVHFHDTETKTRLVKEPPREQLAVEEECKPTAQEVVRNLNSLFDIALDFKDFQ